MAGIRTEDSALSTTSEAGFKVYTPTITTIESTTSTTSAGPSPSTTTHLSIYSNPFLYPELLNDHAGSVSSVNTQRNQTALVFECTLGGGSSGCGPDGYGPRVTVTTDPTLFAYTASYGAGGEAAGYTRKRTYYVACDMAGDESESSAGCTTTWTEWASSAGATTTNRAVSLSGYPRDGIIVVPVTAGVEMLAGPTPAASATTTAPSETGSDPGISGAESESGSGAGPSSALIAGAVVGALVACVLIGGALWFWMRRRRRVGMEGKGSRTRALIAELEGKDVHKAELPAREVAAVEVSGRGARDRVYELPTSPIRRPHD
jgi:hypothetical protein